MGISYALASMIVQEHKHQPIKGKVLLVGRQTIDMNVEVAIKLVEQVLGHVRTKSPLVDVTTRARDELAISRDTISDVGFFSLFTDAEVVAVDVTDYEGADIVHDMCTALPTHMIEDYDFVFNGSCLDNIFDVAAAIRNFGLCLKPTGRLFQIELGTSSRSSYVSFSPEWFIDFFVSNDWEDGSIYVCRVGDEVGGYKFMKNPWDLYHWQPFSLDENGINYERKPRPYLIGMEYIVSVAQRGNGTVNINPIQAIYRPRETFVKQVKTMFRWISSSRQLFIGNSNGPQYPYSVDDLLKDSEKCYHYCGTIRHPSPLL